MHSKYATLAKKIETGTQAKHRRVHARQITRLCHVRAVVSIFLARVVLMLLIRAGLGTDKQHACSHTIVALLLLTPSPPPPSRGPPPGHQRAYHRAHNLTYTGQC